MISYLCTERIWGTINKICSTNCHSNMTNFCSRGELNYPVQINDILSRITTQPMVNSCPFLRKGQNRNYNITSWLCIIECVLTWLMLFTTMRLVTVAFWLKFLKCRHYEHHVDYDIIYALLWWLIYVLWDRKLIFFAKDWVWL